MLNVSSSSIDFDEYMDLNAKLHNQFASICASTVMLNELARVSKLPMASPGAFLGGQAASRATLQSLFTAQEQHRSIFEAICNREGARAEALGREHARLAYQNLDRFLEAGAGATRQTPGLALVVDFHKNDDKLKAAS
ncbi:MAG: FCD domain-containing protein [Ahrensia sp.]|nr:FCD domain-containing protein [Ahrensia sp.]